MKRKKIITLNVQSYTQIEVYADWSANGNSMAKIVWNFNLSFKSSLSSIPKKTKSIFAFQWSLTYLVEMDVGSPPP